MPFLFILISLGLTLVAYLVVVRRDNTWVNVLTPILLTFIPAYYLLELVGIHYFGYSGSLRAYAFCYATYAAHFITLAFAYSMIRRPKLRLPFARVAISPWAPYLVLGLAAVVYLPILIEFSGYLTQPREIYIRTRTGYGHWFFVSTALTYLAFILCLFKEQSFRGEKLLFFVACAVLCLMHGSKGQVVQLVFIALLYGVYVQRRRFGFKRAMLVGGAFAVALTGLFVLLRSATATSADDMLMTMAGYSDYNRNAMMLIDDDPDLHYGALTLEQSVYTRVPRVLYPDKPKDWGTFYLAKKYYPVWFEKETGAPSFGMLGVPFADFGYLSIFYIMIWAGVVGMLLRLFVDRLRQSVTPSDFVMVLFLSGVSVMPGGIGYLLIDHFLLALLLSFALRIRLRLSLQRESVLSGESLAAGESHA